MKKPIALLALLAVLWLALPAEAAAPTVVLGSAVLEVAAGQTAAVVRHRDGRPGSVRPGDSPAF